MQRNKKCLSGGCCIYCLIFVFIMIIQANSSRKYGEYNYTPKIWYNSQCDEESQEDGYCIYKDQECVSTGGDTLNEELMPGFSLEHCKLFCSSTVDCMSFESRYQEECRMAFKSSNTERTSLDSYIYKSYQDEPDMASETFENGTSCYVKILKDSKHV